MNKKYLAKIVKDSKNISDVSNKIFKNKNTGNRQTIKKYIKLYDLDISHFKNNNNNTFRKKINLNDILVENSTYNRMHLKNRLYKEGLKGRKCEICGQTEEWHGKHMSLILDHINGINDDNRLENLRILCPNCNATLDTHCGKNIKHTEKKKYYCECGNEKSKNADFCEFCYKKKSRIVERPNYKTLILDIDDLGYVGTGKKYGVSDNAIRKWKKYYEKIENDSNLSLPTKIVPIA